MADDAPGGLIQRLRERGWMGAHNQFDLGDKDKGLYHLHQCSAEACAALVECEDCCDDEQETQVFCSKHSA